MEILNVETKVRDLKKNEFGEYEVKYYEGENTHYFVNHFSTLYEAADFIKTNTPRPIKFDKPLHACCTPLPNDFDKICSGLAKVLTEKNKLYGNSALNPIEVFNGKSKVGQRADDKLSRIQNSPTLRKNDVCDLIGYLILICKENNWTDFTDQID